MPIAATDLKFFPAERMSDDANAGGRRAGTALLTGVENNVFPDVTSDDRLQGITRARKAFPSVTGADASVLLSAGVLLNAPPSDPKAEIALVLYGDDSTTREQMMAAGAPYVSNLYTIWQDGSREYVADTGTYAGGASAITLNNAAFNIGETIAVENLPSGAAFTQPTFDLTGSVGGGQRANYVATLQRAATLHVVTGVAGLVATVSPPLPGTGSLTAIVRRPAIVGRVYGCLPVSAALSASDTTLDLDDWTVGLVPTDGTAYPSPTLGIPPAARTWMGGRAPAAVSGDLATLWHEAETTPATQANSDVINVGRTNVSQLAVVDANGDEIGRALSDGPALSGVGFTVDLAAGTVTCTDVSGWAQPVSVRHRIEERVRLQEVQGGAVTLAAPLARAFGSGSYITTEAPLGDLQVVTGAGFFQQAWTRTWSDSVIGTPVGALYVGDIGLEADGAETDRFAVVFSTATQYVLHSERWGVIGSGNIGTDYTPLNPATGAPLLTLYAANWVTAGISLGNVFRFNTVGAYRPLWVLRCVDPGSSSGNSAAMLILRGSVDA